MAKYTIEDTTLIAIADSIRAKTGGVDGITPENMPTEIEGIETGGGTEEIENLIDESGVLDSTDGTATEKVEQLIDKAENDNYFRLAIENNTEANGLSLFKGYTGTKVPYFGTMSTKNTASLFNGAKNITSINFYIDCPYSTRGNGMFYGTSSMKYLKGVNCVNMVSLRQMFAASGIEVIEEPLNVPNVTDYVSAFSDTIKEIRFIAETIKVSLTISSPVLSDESIQSIIGGLNSEVTGQTLTIPRAAVKKAFETSEGANDGDTSETWNALVASKPNWTITLS